MFTPSQISRERRDSFLAFTPFSNNIPNFDVEAPPSTNTSFNNSLPQFALSPIKDVSVSNPSSPAIEKTGKVPSRSKPFVLVVEDNTINQRVMSAFLKREGVTFEMANNGQEAINKCSRYHYDAIFMDINMPIVDGYTATRSIRDMEGKSECAPTPIIAMTAHAFSGDREKCLDAGMSEYLCKPVKMVELRQILSKVISRSDEDSS